MFQSLFYWKFYFNNIRIIGGDTWWSVSILILLEVLLQLICSFVILCLDNQFQSLFYWKFYFNGRIIIIKFKCNVVSILILLEVLLQLDGGTIKRKYQSCFNPYFTGSSTSTIIKPFPVKLYPAVSILILLEVLLQLNFLFSTFIVTSLFQSLFYWKFYFNAILQAILFIAYIMFQSLFYWKFYFNQKTSKTIHASCISGFNPYFTGSSTSTFAVYSMSFCKIGFQSLFYWKFYFNAA